MYDGHANLHQARLLCTSLYPTFYPVMCQLNTLQIPFEILLLGMQLNHYWGMSRAIEPVQLTPLLATLYTDGVIYFVATITVRVWGGCAVRLSAEHVASNTINHLFLTVYLSRSKFLVYDIGRRPFHQLCVHLMGHTTSEQGVAKEYRGHCSDFRDHCYTVDKETTDID